MNGSGDLPWWGAILIFYVAGIVLSFFMVLDGTGDPAFLAYYTVGWPLALLIAGIKSFWRGLVNQLKG